jgi:hypothetical protein
MRAEDGEFKASLAYTMILCLKKKKPAAQCYVPFYTNDVNFKINSTYGYDRG